MAEQCGFCHGADGKGLADLGAPDLTDAISLYGDDYESVRAQVENPRGGAMPGWGDRLPSETIKQLAIYVHALGRRDVAGDGRGARAAWQHRSAAMPRRLTRAVPAASAVR